MIAPAAVRIVAPVVVRVSVATERMDSRTTVCRQRSARAVMSEAERRGIQLHRPFVLIYDRALGYADFSQDAA